MSVQEIQPTDLADDAVLLDVREQDEWDAGHAPNSVHVPLGQISDRIAEVPEGRPVAVICRGGVRSLKGGDALVAAGVDAVSVAGGMQAWAAAGKPVVTDAGTAGDVI